MQRPFYFIFRVWIIPMIWTSFSLNGKICCQSVPTLVAPPDMVISCQVPVTTQALMDISNPQFGKLVMDLAKREKLTTYDIICPAFCTPNLITNYPGFDSLAPTSNPGAPNKACKYFHSFFDSSQPSKIFELQWGFDGYVLSASKTFIKIMVKDERICNQGRISRTFEVKDSGSNITVRAKQTIWVVNCDPIQIPPECLVGKNTIINSCRDTLPTLARPCLDQLKNSCSLVSIEPLDEIRFDIPNSCFTILRTWVIIDWCQYDPKLSPVLGRWELFDTLSVVDQEKPILNAAIASCHQIDSVLPSGEKWIQMEIVAKHKDDCTPEDFLNVQYTLDLFNDNTIDAWVGPLSKAQFKRGETALHHDNPYALDPNNPNDATGSYPEGIHKLVWSATDGCGNSSTQEFIFATKDQIPPRILCFNANSIFEIIDSGKVQIFAKKLIDMASDNCTQTKNLQYYFDDDSTKSSLIYTCEDLKNAGTQHELFIQKTITVVDESGNKTLCDKSFSIKDAINNDCNLVSLEPSFRVNPIQIYPNPFSGTITISISSSKEIGKYEILDVSGQKVSHGTLNQNVFVHTLFFSNTLPPGIYFLKTYGLREVYLNKLTKI